MNYSDVGVVRADEFDIANTLKYSSSDEALVHSSNATTTSPSTGILDPEADHVIAVPFDYNRSTLGLRKDTIARLFQDWKVPKVATTHSSFAYQTTRPVFYFLTQLAGYDAIGYADIYVWQALDIDTSHVRSLILYPLWMRKVIEAILKPDSSTSWGLDDPKWPLVHMVVVQEAVSTWVKAHPAAVFGPNVGMQGLRSGLDKSLDARLIKTCDNSMLWLNKIFGAIVKLKKIMAVISEHLERKLRRPDFSEIHPALLHMRNMHNNIDTLMVEYSRLEDLVLVRGTFSTSMKIKNASFLRANTIALRRLAEQNQIDAQQAKPRADLAQRNSQTMKIASMTMLCLPADFIATVFSTPFLEIDDDKRFNNLNRILIYLVFTVAITAVTFLGSIVWDNWNKLRANLERPSTLNSSDTFVELEELPYQSEAHLLEPEPHTDLSDQELAQRVFDLFSYGIDRAQDETDPAQHHQKLD